MEEESRGDLNFSAIKLDFTTTAPSQAPNTLRKIILDKNALKLNEGRLRENKFMNTGRTPCDDGLEHEQVKYEECAETEAKPKKKILGRIQNTVRNDVENEQCGKDRDTHEEQKAKKRERIKRNRRKQNQAQNQAPQQDKPSPDQQANHELPQQSQRVKMLIVDDFGDEEPAQDATNQAPIQDRQNYISEGLKDQKKHARKKNLQRNKKSQQQPGQDQPSYIVPADDIQVQFQQPEAQQQQQSDPATADIPSYLKLSTDLSITGCAADHLETFIHEPVPKGYKVHCLVDRDQGTLSSTYRMIFDNPDAPNHIISAYRRFSSTYVMSLSQTDFSESSMLYLGKLKTNMSNTIYDLVSKGQSPNSGSNLDRKTLRKLLVTIQYQENDDCPRKMKIMIPKLGLHAEEYPRQVNPDDSLRCRRHKNQTMILRNKSPKFDPQQQAFVLSFVSKRQMESSIKNFCVQDQATGDNIMTFGKVDKRLFSLTVGWPFSLLQGFAVGLSTFQKKHGLE